LYLAAVDFVTHVLKIQKTIVAEDSEVSEDFGGAVGAFAAILELSVAGTTESLLPQQ